MPSDAPCRYQIVFREECAHLLAGILADAVIESRPGYTSMVATVRDQSEFYGLLDRLAGLALWPVSLIELDLTPKDEGPVASGRHAEDDGHHLGGTGAGPGDDPAQGPGPDPPALSSSTAGDLSGGPGP
jgi:hypothetical protein